MKLASDVNRDWQKWINEKVSSDSLSQRQKMQLIAAITPEVRWYDHTMPSEETVVMRIAKMNSMNDTSIKVSEPMWEYRIQFLQWLCV